MCVSLVCSVLNSVVLLVSEFYSVWFVLSVIMGFVVLMIVWVLLLFIMLFWYVYGSVLCV